MEQIITVIDHDDYDYDCEMYLLRHKQIKIML